MAALQTFPTLPINTGMSVVTSDSMKKALLRTNDIGKNHSDFSYKNSRSPVDYYERK